MKISPYFYYIVIAVVLELQTLQTQALPTNRDENKTQSQHYLQGLQHKPKRSPLRKPLRFTLASTQPRVSKRQLFNNYGLPGPGVTGADEDDLIFHTEDVQSLNTFESILPSFGIKSHNIALIRSMLSGNMLKYNLLLLKKTVALLRKINHFLTNYLPPGGQQNSLFHAAVNHTKNYELLNALINAGYGQQLLNINGQQPASTPSPVSTISTKLVNSHKHYDIPYNNRPMTTSERPRMIYDYPVSEVKEIIEETERIIQKHKEQTTVPSYRAPTQPWNTPDGRLVVTEPPKHLDFVPNFSGYAGSSVDGSAADVGFAGTNRFNLAGHQPIAPKPDFDLPFVHKTTTYNLAPEDDNLKLLNSDSGFDFQGLPTKDSIPNFHGNFDRATEYTIDYVTNEGEVNLDDISPQNPPLDEDFAGDFLKEPHITNFDRKEVQIGHERTKLYQNVIIKPDLPTFTTGKYQNVGQIPLDKHNIFDNVNSGLINSYGQPLRLRN